MPPIRTKTTRTSSYHTRPREPRNRASTPRIPDLYTKVDLDVKNALGGSSDYQAFQKIKEEFLRSTRDIRNTDNSKSLKESNIKTKHVFPVNSGVNVKDTYKVETDTKSEKLERDAYEPYFSSNNGNKIVSVFPNFPAQPGGNRDEEKVQLVTPITLETLVTEEPKFREASSRDKDSSKRLPRDFSHSQQVFRSPNSVGTFHSTEINHSTEKYGKSKSYQSQTFLHTTAAPDHHIKEEKAGPSTEGSFLPPHITLHTTARPGKANMPPHLKNQDTVVLALQNIKPTDIPDGYELIPLKQLTPEYEVVPWQEAQQVLNVSVSPLGEPKPVKKSLTRDNYVSKEQAAYHKEPPYKHPRHNDNDNDKYHVPHYNAALQSGYSSYKESPVKAPISSSLPTRSYHSTTTKSLSPKTAYKTTLKPFRSSYPPKQYQNTRNLPREPQSGYVTATPQFHLPPKQYHETKDAYSDLKRKQNIYSHGSHLTHPPEPTVAPASSNNFKGYGHHNDNIPVHKKEYNNEKPWFQPPPVSPDLPPIFYDDASKEDLSTDDELKLRHNDIQPAVVKSLEYSGFERNTPSKQHNVIHFGSDFRLRDQREHHQIYHTPTTHTTVASPVRYHNQSPPKYRNHQNAPEPERNHPYHLNVKPYEEQVLGKTLEHPHDLEPNHELPFHNLHKVSLPMPSPNPSHKIKHLGTPSPVISYHPSTSLSNLSPHSYEHWQTPTEIFFKPTPSSYVRIQYSSVKGSTTSQPTVKSLAPSRRPTVFSGPKHHSPVHVITPVPHTTSRPLNDYVPHSVLSHPHIDKPSRYPKDLQLPSELPLPVVHEQHDNLGYHGKVQQVPSLKNLLHKTTPKPVGIHYSSTYRPNPSPTYPPMQYRNYSPTTDSSVVKSLNTKQSGYGRQFDMLLSGIRPSPGGIPIHINHFPTPDPISSYERKAFYTSPTPVYFNGKSRPKKEIQSSNVERKQDSPKTTTHVGHQESTHKPDEHKASFNAEFRSEAHANNAQHIRNALSGNKKNPQNIKISIPTLVPAAIGTYQRQPVDPFTFGTTSTKRSTATPFQSVATTSVKELTTKQSSKFPQGGHLNNVNKFIPGQLIIKEVDGDMHVKDSLKGHAKTDSGPVPYLVDEEPIPFLEVSKDKEKREQNEEDYFKHHSSKPEKSGASPFFSTKHPETPTSGTKAPNRYSSILPRVTTYQKKGNNQILKADTHHTLKQLTSTLRSLTITVRGLNSTIMEATERVKPKLEVPILMIRHMQNEIARLSQTVEGLRNQKETHLSKHEVKDVIKGVIQEVNKVAQLESKLQDHGLSSDVKFEENGSANAENLKREVSKFMTSPGVTTSIEVGSEVKTTSPSSFLIPVQASIAPKKKDKESGVIFSSSLSFPNSNKVKKESGFKKMSAVVGTSFKVDKDGNILEHQDSFEIPLGKTYFHSSSTPKPLRHSFIPPSPSLIPVTASPTRRPPTLTPQFNPSTPFPSHYESPARFTGYQGAGSFNRHEWLPSPTPSVVHGVSPSNIVRHHGSSAFATASSNNKIIRFPGVQAQERFDEDVDLQDKKNNVYSTSYYNSAGNENLANSPVVNSPSRRPGVNVMADLAQFTNRKNLLDVNEDSSYITHQRRHPSMEVIMYPSGQLLKGSDPDHPPSSTIGPKLENALLNSYYRNQLPHYVLAKSKRRGDFEDNNHDLQNNWRNPGPSVTPAATNNVNEGGSGIINGLIRTAQDDLKLVKNVIQLALSS